MPLYKTINTNCDTLNCLYFGSECKACNNEFCTECSIGFYLNKALSKCGRFICELLVPCSEINPLCIQCNNTCTKCATPYELFTDRTKQCDSYGVFSFTTELISVTEGDNVELNIVREYGSIGRVVLRVYSLYIENWDELRVIPQREVNYVELKNVDIEFLEGETIKTISMKTYKDTINDKQPKKMRMFMEHKEGVEISIRQVECFVYIYDLDVPDSYYSYGKINNYENMAQIKGLSSGTNYAGTIYSYIEEGVKKGGTDTFFAILEKYNENQELTVTSIKQAIPIKDNTYEFIINLPTEGKYKVTLCVSIKGVMIEYYRNMVFTGKVFIRRIENYFPKRFEREVNTPLLSVIITTIIRIDITGIYTFYISGTANDFFEMWIDGTLIASFTQAETLEESMVELSLVQRSYYLLRLRYVHGEGEPCVNVRWKVPNRNEVVNIPLEQLHVAESIRFSPYLLYAQ